MKYKAVIFDFGGVIHSIEGISAKSRVLQALNKDKVISEEEFLPLFRKYIEKLGLGEMTEPDFWSHLCNELNTHIPENHKELLQDDLRSNAKIFTEMTHLIQELRNKNIQS
jgi:phosphoglycolate phosphatase-like HAD superfamily hydrolase